MRNYQKRHGVLLAIPFDIFQVEGADKIPFEGRIFCRKPGEGSPANDDRCKTGLQSAPG